MSRKHLSSEIVSDEDMDDVEETADVSMGDDAPASDEVKDEEAKEADSSTAARPKSNDEEEPVEDSDDNAENENDDDVGEEDAQPSSRSRRNEPIDDDEQDDDEDDDEEDDDDEGGGSRRRKRRKRNVFLDVEAEVDDDEEDLDDDEDEVGAHDGFIADQEEDLPEGDEDDRQAARHNELDQRRRMVDEENYRQIAEEMKDKYGRSAPKFRGDTDIVPQRLLMPSVKDANLWLVRCKPGKERDIVLSLMRKIIDSEFKDPIEILSAFERDSLPGYLYIEARRQAHVQKAISGLINVYGNKIILVPIEEMADLLKIKKKEQEIVPGGWVRIKRGKYAGDLAQVIDVTETGDAIRVKMIPRLDLNVKDLDAAEKKRKKGSAMPIAFRPAQKFFNPDEVRRIFGGASVQKRGRAFLHGNDHYEDGYLEKDVRISGLVTENVNPTLDEITRFSTGNQDEETGLDLSLLNKSGNNQNINAFQPGDHVEVYEGEQLGVHGIVEKIEADIVTVMPANEELKGSKVEIPARSLRKQFKQGDHVKVINGRYIDETGLIVRIVDNVVTLLSDLSLKEVSVFSKDLQEAAEVSTGANSLSGFELHDLVQLDVQTAGVIVRVERDSLKVMDQNASIRTVQPHQVTKLESRRAVALDRNNMELRIGDTVKEADGEGRQGTILHIYKGVFAWLRNREMTANGGVFTTRANSLTSTAPKTSNGGLDLSKMNAAAMRTPQGQPGAPNGAPQVGGGGRDRMQGKTVSIISGPHKGYMGIVKEVNGELARVELHTNMKTVTIKKSILLVKDSMRNGSQVPGNVGGFYGNGGGYRNGSSGGYGRSEGNGGGFYAGSGDTPAWDSGSHATGSYGGSRTPAWGSGAGNRTPAWQNGSRTPAYAAAGGQTPNPYNDGGRTPAWDSGSKTPRRVDDGGRTPAWQAGSRTPAWQSGSGGGSSWAAEDSWNTSAASASTSWNSAAETPGPSWDAPTPGPHGAPTPAPSGGWAASTPAAYPSTPGGYNADTPYDAPTPGIAATPGPMGAPTPGPHYGAPTPYSAPTPAYLDGRTPGPMTPAPGGIAATPAASGAWGRDMPPPRVGDALENWVAAGIEVRITRHRRNKDSFDNGQYDDQHAEIMRVEPGGIKCSIRLLSNKETLVISADYLVPVPPSQKGEKARVLAGPLKNHIGTMLSINSAEGEGSITSKGKGFEVVELRFIARMPGADDE